MRWVISTGRQFPLTLPAGGATDRWWIRPIPSLFLSPLPARGATIQGLTCFSIRSAFLSTLPARGATGLAMLRIAAPPYFYPRSPRGERRTQGRISYSH